MNKVKITERKVVLSLTKKEFYVLLELLDDRFNECSCDVDSSRGIPIPKSDRAYIQKCELICKLDYQFNQLSDDIYVADMPCPFDDSREGEAFSLSALSSCRLFPPCPPISE